MTVDMTDTQIQSILHEVLLGALDTALIGCNALWHLSRNPEVLAKVRSELAEVAPSGNWTVLIIFLW